jgi:hydroxymethylglutaryl-CoA lyase
MAGTPDVLRAIKPHRGTSYPVLVPNAHGLHAFLSLLRSHPHLRPHFDEISVFTAATDGFNKANTNCTVAESLARLAPVVDEARREGLRVRGYVSVIVDCPYEGRVDPRKVREVTKALDHMGCYEISLGDTVGRGTPQDITAVFNEVVKDVPVHKLAGHVRLSYTISRIRTGLPTRKQLSSTIRTEWASRTV